MIGFNRFKSKVKSVPIIPNFLKTNEKEIKTNTLCKKAFFQNKKILVLGNKGDFLSNLFATVLHQYEPSIKLVSICKNINDNINSQLNSIDNKDLTVENIDLVVDLEASSKNKVELEVIENKIKNIVKDFEILVLCFEWCEFSELYKKLEIIAKACLSLNSKGVEVIKKIIVTFPIGVEDSQFHFDQNSSIETLFSPISTIFLFYSSLMQWLFVGPPTYFNSQLPTDQQHYIQLPISKQDDEGCFWLDCDDLIKVLVDLLMTIDSIRENKMYVLTGKECLTLKEISNILFNEFKIMVEDLDNNSVNISVLKKKFYNYLASPISLLSSPDIEILLNNTPNTFSNFLRKCNDTQSFISIYKSRSRSNSKSTTNGISYNSNSLNTNATSPTSSNTSPTSSITSSISTVSSSAYKFVFSSLNFLKYSKDFIEDTIYKSPPPSNTPMKKTNLPEITQYISLLNESFKKVYIENKNNQNMGSSRVVSMNGNIENIEFTLEDYTQEVQYEITVLNPLIQPEPQTWELSVLSPKIFQSIRDTYRIKDFLLSPTDLNDIISFVEVETIGRSGSFFFRSIDDRYFIKTIPSNEYDTFIKLFQSYHQHIVKYQSTLLPRFYGYYKLKGKLKAYNIYGAETYQYREIIFCVMSNLFYSNDPKLFINEKYDLKGSTVGRFVNIDSPSSTNSNTEHSDDLVGTDQEFIPTLKDLNLKRKFYLGKNKKLFIAQVNADTEWMLSHGICDYSMLVGIHLPTHDELVDLNSQSPNANSNSGFISSTKCDVSFFKQNNFGIMSSVIKPLPLINIKKQSSQTLDEDNNPTTLVNTTVSTVNQLPGTPPIPNYKTKPKTPLVLPQSSSHPPDPTLPTSPTLQTSPTSSPPQQPLNITSFISTQEHFNPTTHNNNDDENINGIVYFFGLIDILTTYNLKKRGETALKSMVFDKAKISSINPTDYQSRFTKFIESTLE